MGQLGDRLVCRFVRPLFDQSHSRSARHSHNILKRHTYYYNKSKYILPICCTPGHPTSPDRPQRCPSTQSGCSSPSRHSLARWSPSSRSPRVSRPARARCPRFPRLLHRWRSQFVFCHLIEIMLTKSSRIIFINGINGWWMEKLKDR